MAEQRTAPRSAVRVVLYAPDGAAVRVRPIDAAELMATGYTTEPPAPKPAAKAVAEPKQDPTGAAGKK